MDYNTFKQNITGELNEKLLAHFNNVYECSKLEEHELKIAFLAYLYINDNMYTDGVSLDIPSGLGVEWADYEISFEGGEGCGGGVNFDITYDFYDFAGLSELLRSQVFISNDSLMVTNISDIVTVACCDLVSKISVN